MRRVRRAEASGYSQAWYTLLFVENEVFYYTLLDCVKVIIFTYLFNKDLFYKTKKIRNIHHSFREGIRGEDFSQKSSPLKCQQFSKTSCLINGDMLQLSKKFN